MHDIGLEFCQTTVSSIELIVHIKIVTGIIYTQYTSTRDKLICIVDVGLEFCQTTVSSIELIVHIKIVTGIIYTQYTSTRDKLICIVHV